MPKTAKTAKTARTPDPANDVEMDRLSEIAVNAPNPSSEHDDEMDHLVSFAEMEFAKRNQRNQRELVDLVDASTRGVLTLFPYAPRDPEEGKTYPAMKGYLDSRRVKIPVAAFLGTTDEGREFLSLSIGAQGQSHIGGAVFRQEEQNKTNGLWQLAPGKENERHGVIAKTVPIEGTDQYDTVFELRFYGKRVRSAGGVWYIKAQVYPERSGGSEAMDGCF